MVKKWYSVQIQTPTKLSRGKLDLKKKKTGTKTYGLPRNILQRIWSQMLSILQKWLNVLVVEAEIYILAKENQ